MLHTKLQFSIQTLFEKEKDIFVCLTFVPRGTWMKCNNKTSEVNAAEGFKELLVWNYSFNIGIKNHIGIDILYFDHIGNYKCGRHSSVDLSMPTILRPWVLIPSTTSMLYSIRKANCDVKRTNVNRKRGLDRSIFFFKKNLVILICPCCHTLKILIFCWRQLGSVQKDIFSQLDLKNLMMFIDYFEFSVILLP